MPQGFRLLVVSNSLDFREAAGECTRDFDLSVKTIGFTPELPTALAAHGFDWVVLDVDMGQDEAFEAVEGLACTSARMMLVGTDEVALAAARAAAALNGLTVAAAISGPLSRQALHELFAVDDTVEAQLLPGVTTIPDGEVEVHYQPMVSFETDLVGSVEALVRWRHPVHGLLLPGRFIALAERSGAIVSLTWTVLRQVIRQQVAWKRAGLTLAVSVNVSPVFLAALETAEPVLDLLAREGFEPSHLILEITETEAARNPPLANALLGRLRDSGIAISMDDYGVGFSTLQRLQLFPFSNIKIDRWLVAGLDSDPKAQRTVRMLAALGRQQQFTLTGEGIETRQQWCILRELGCHFAQGYLIAHPMPAGDLPHWLERRAHSGTISAGACG